MARTWVNACTPGAEDGGDIGIRPGHVFGGDAAGRSGAHGGEKSAVHDRNREPGIFIEEKDGAENGRQVILADIFVINRDYFGSQRLEVFDVCRHEERQPGFVGQTG